MSWNEIDEGIYMNTVAPDRAAPQRRQHLLVPFDVTYKARSPPELGAAALY
eukprot:CAMPEP_0198734150 /NCGR_PEP_ID=MMETSP1475-20131203/50747_1 /TAXON_ID= ORGANISM="Unidentified sp., Strain CCMP1999" /NCGR_SAMPLE_ID=MMETSP1475 /ASSEMBLY_ACC=CAM_ASM_001111 /LENGTH=50 /DNA_ID=CAMNT_0044497567 /DNA_START=153 /DNA_END=305 /DNA_ORIENTATION=-